MNPKAKILAAAVSGLAAVAGVAGPAQAAGIVMLPAQPNRSKTVITQSRSRPGQYVVTAKLTAVNWGNFDIVTCRLNTDARESGGASGARVVADDFVSVGDAVDFDGDIELEAVFDSTRRFRAWVTCSHQNFNSTSIYIEPNTMTIVRTANS